MPSIREPAQGAQMSLTAVATRRSARRAGDAAPRRGKPRGGRRDDSSFWHFPTARLFVPDRVAMDTSREAYLGLNRVGGILSEAARSKPPQGEPRHHDMWDVADALQEAGASLSHSDHVLLLPAHR